MFGLVASDPTVSRLIDRALAAIAAARARARAGAWKLAGAHAPDRDISGDHPVIVDVDATLVTAHSDKEKAAPTFKRGYGFHPLCAFVDHGAEGTGEPLSNLLRPGNAGSNTTADHISVARDALRQLPFTGKGGRIGRKVLIRADSGGGTHEFVDWLHARKLGYSLGFPLPDDAVQRIAQIPDQAWTPAYDDERTPRDGAWVAEATGVLDLAGRPSGMRVIVRKERPHPGAQLRFTDADGNRLTAFATNTGRGQLADLELRHRRRARAEDRIRAAKATGLSNLPLHGFAHNQPGPHRPPAPDHPARTDLTSPKPSLPTSTTTGHVELGDTPVDRGAKPAYPGHKKEVTEPPTPRRAGEALTRATTRLLTSCGVDALSTDCRRFRR